MGPEKLRPFQWIGHFVSEGFMDKAIRWNFLVGHFGMSKTPKQPKSRKELNVFMGLCHAGWKTAQLEIAAFLIETLSKRSAAQEEEQRQRGLKNKNAVTDARVLLKAIEWEIAIARRFLDAVIWTIVRCEHSTLRRLWVAGANHSLSIENIEVAMHATESLNRRPLTMVLATDMLSIVHVGDLFHFDASTGATKFIELKSGTKNIEISQLADYMARSGDQAAEAAATASFSDVDRKHYRRAKNQSLRNQTILTTINNEGGSDHNTNAQVVITEIGEIPQYWTVEILKCFQKLSNDRMWAIGDIEGCVFFGVYSNQEMAYVGFNAWMDQLNCTSRIFNLMDSFSDPGHRPLACLQLPHDLREEILSGKIIVVICLDVRRFIELGNRMKPGMFELASKRETAEMKQRTYSHDFTVDGRSIKAKFGINHMLLSDGIRSRIVFDQHLPTQLIAHNIKISDVAIAEALSRHSNSGCVA